MKKLILPLILLVLAACTEPPPPARPAPPSGPPLALAPTATPVMVVGDRLSSAYGMKPEQGWAALLDARMKEQGMIRPDQSVLNASVGADATFDALVRMPRLLAEHQPKIVVIQLGINDLIRPIAPSNLADFEDNLDLLAVYSAKSGAAVVIVGVDPAGQQWLLPMASAARIYKASADRHRAALVPNLVKGVFASPDLLQADRVHPSPAAQPVLLENVWPAIQQAVAELEKKQSSRRP